MQYMNSHTDAVLQLTVVFILSRSNPTGCQHLCKADSKHWNPSTERIEFNWFSVLWGISIFPGALLVRNVGDGNIIFD